MGKEKKKDSEQDSKDIRSSMVDAYKNMGQGLIDAQEKDKAKRKEVLREGIEKVEKKAKKELKSSRLLVNKILEIREKAGLSSTIGTAGKVRGGVFGKGNFDEILIREILTIGTEELDDMGGAISVANFVEYFKKTRTNWKVKTKQILDAINDLEKQKIIPEKLEIGENEVLIRFKPLETSSDIHAVLRLATGLEYLTDEIVSSHLGWTMERAKSTLNKMEDLSLTIYDPDESKYYFPGVFKIVE